MPPRGSRVAAIDYSSVSSNSPPSFRALSNPVPGPNRESVCPSSRRRAPNPTLAKSNGSAAEVLAEADTCTVLGPAATTELLRQQRHDGDARSASEYPETTAPQDAGAASVRSRLSYTSHERRSPSWLDTNARSGDRITTSTRRKRAAFGDRADRDRQTPLARHLGRASSGLSQLMLVQQSYYLPLPPASRAIVRVSALSATRSMCSAHDRRTGRDNMVCRTTILRS